MHPAWNSGPRTTSMILRWIPHGCLDFVRDPASHVEHISPHWIPHGMYGITYEVLGLTLNNGSRPTPQPHIDSRVGIRIPHEVLEHALWMPHGIRDRVRSRIPH